MKFARLLRTTAEDLPELQCLFQIYKHLKKQLKKLPAKGGQAPADSASADADATAPGGMAELTAHGGEASAPSRAQPVPACAAAHGSTLSSEHSAIEPEEEARFTAVLTDHLQRLNDRFLEREEMCVIQLERLEAEASALAAPPAQQPTATGDGDSNASSRGDGQGAANKAADQRAQLYKRFVNFHGAHTKGQGGGIPPGGLPRPYTHCCTLYAVVRARELCVGGGGRGRAAGARRGAGAAGWPPARRQPPAPFPHCCMCICKCRSP